MHGDRRAGQPLQLGDASRMVAVAVRHQDVSDVALPERADGLHDRRRASRDPGVDQRQPRAGLGEEGVHEAEGDLPKAGHDLLHRHEGSPPEQSFSDLSVILAALVCGRPRFSRKFHDVEATGRRLANGRRPAS